MSTPKESSRRAARIVLRLQKHTQEHHCTSYRESGAKSSAAHEKLSVDGSQLSEKTKTAPSPPRTDNRQPTTLPRLSWEDFPDDRWPSDFWRVGADLDPDLWPELWTFLAEDKTVPPPSSVLSLPPPRAEGGS